MRASGRTCGAPQEPRKLNSIVAARRAKLSQPAGITITALWLPKNSQLGRPADRLRSSVATFRSAISHAGPDEPQSLSVTGTPGRRVPYRRLRAAGLPNGTRNYPDADRRIIDASFRERRARRKALVGQITPDERIDRSGPPGLGPVSQEIADRQSPRLLPRHCDIGQAVAASPTAAARSAMIFPGSWTARGARLVDDLSHAPDLPATAAPGREFRSARERPTHTAAPRTRTPAAELESR